VHACPCINVRACVLVCACACAAGVHIHGRAPGSVSLACCAAPSDYRSKAPRAPKLRACNGPSAPFIFTPWSQHLNRAWGMGLRGDAHARTHTPHHTPHPPTAHAPTYAISLYQGWRHGDIYTRDEDEEGQLPSLDHRTAATLTGRRGGASCRGERVVARRRPQRPASLPVVPPTVCARPTHLWLGSGPPGFSASTPTRPRCATRRQTC